MHVIKSSIFILLYLMTFPAYADGPVLPFNKDVEAQKICNEADSALLDVAETQQLKGLLEAHPEIVECPNGVYNSQILGYAIMRDNMIGATLLLSHGADPNGVDLNKYYPDQHDAQSTALEVAIFGEKIEFVRFMLENHADINHRNSKGRQPIHYAAWRDPEILKTIIAAGADVDARDLAGTTPLHLAVKGENIKDIIILLDAGANIEAKDYYGRTPLAVATGETGYDDAVITLLLQRGAKIEALPPKCMEWLNWMRDQYSNIAAAMPRPHK